MKILGEKIEGIFMIMCSVMIFFNTRTKITGNQKNRIQTSSEFKALYIKAHSQESEKIIHKHNIATISKSSKRLISDCIFKNSNSSTTTTTNHPIKKWAKDLSRHFFKEELQKE